MVTFDPIKFAKRVGEQSVSLYALEKLGANRFINNDENMITRNVKRAGVWYISNELIDQAIEGHSNLTEMNPTVLINDVGFNTVASMVVETSGIYNVFGNLVDDTVPLNPELSDILATALIVETVNIAGKSLEDMAVKNIAKMFGY